MTQPLSRSQQFDQRLAPYYDELKWLYTELYGETPCLGQLIETARDFFVHRKPALAALDAAREADPDWYRRSDMMGMMMYTDLFAGNLEGLADKIDYLRELRVRYLHLMPLLKMPEKENDGGYAVSDFRAVDPRIGTMEQLEAVADLCREKGMSICLDFIVNHTSDEHEWAMRAKNGEWEYQQRYSCYDNFDIPSQFERTMPQVFPNTAPGNFIWNEQMHKFVLSTFNPYQWDMNYKNPVVFNEMAANLLFLANVGIDIFRIDAVPYIWKELGTTCRNLPQVHTIMRMLRILAQVVCPAVIFKGEVVMKPSEVAPYFGPVGKPECDILYNVTTMVCVWNTLATRDVTLLRWQMDAMNALPAAYSFVNYVRCHDDIGWGLDEDSVAYLGMDPLEHKKFLYQFYQGNYPGSFAKGELYNYDPVSQDARSCGTAASLCGVEQALDLHDGYLLELALRRDLLIHTYILSLSGIPVLYSGDELAQCNDNNYRDDPAKAVDSRFLHRGKFDWRAAAHREDEGTVAGRMFTGLQRRIDLRRDHPIFNGDAHVETVETGNVGVLGFRRVRGNDELLAFYNFTEKTQPVLWHLDGRWQELLSDRQMYGSLPALQPYEALWLLRTRA